MEPGWSRSLVMGRHVFGISKRKRKKRSSIVTRRRRQKLMTQTTRHRLVLQQHLHPVMHPSPKRFNHSHIREMENGLHWLVKMENFRFEMPPTERSLANWTHSAMSQPALRSATTARGLPREVLINRSRSGMLQAANCRPIWPGTQIGFFPSPFRPTGKCWHRVAMTNRSSSGILPRKKRLRPCLVIPQECDRWCSLWRVNF